MVIMILNDDGEGVTLLGARGWTSIAQGQGGGREGIGRGGRGYR